MKIKVLKECGIAGKTIKKGTEVEVSNSDATYLIGTGKAAAVEDVKKTKGTADK